MSQAENMVEIFHFGKAEADTAVCHSDENRLMSETLMLKVVWRAVDGQGLGNVNKRK